MVSTGRKSDEGTSGKGEALILKKRVLRPNRLRELRDKLRVFVKSIAHNGKREESPCSVKKEIVIEIERDSGRVHCLKVVVDRRKSNSKRETRLSPEPK